MEGALTEREQALIERYSDLYRAPNGSKRAPTTPEQVRFVAVCRGEADAMTKHEAAFAECMRLERARRHDQGCTRPAVLPFADGRHAGQRGRVGAQERLLDLGGPASDLSAGLLQGLLSDACGALVVTAMTKTEFGRRWKRNLAHAERALVQDGFLTPLVVVVGCDGETHLMPMDLRDEAARLRSVNAARLLAISADAHLVICRCEVWMVVGSELTEGVTPASSDRRLEAVAVTAAARVSAGVERRLSLREIVRGPDGRPAALRDLPGSRPASTLGGVDGWMTDLLAPRRPTEEERALAGALLAAMAQR